MYLGEVHEKKSCRGSRPEVSFEVFCVVFCSYNFRNIHREAPVSKFLFNKIGCLQASTTTFLKNTSDGCSSAWWSEVETLLKDEKL